MQYLKYHRDELILEALPLRQLAEEYGTPLYVYSESQICDNYKRMDDAFAGVPHRLCYAVKANSNPEILRLLAEMGAGADAVSIGEMRLALQAGVAPENIVFAGVGKRDDEIEFAIQKNIRGLNVESEMELQVVADIAARLRRRARVSLRINPDIDIHGHPYISTGRHQDKFGIALDVARRLIAEYRDHPHVQLVGLHAHLGSQITEILPYRKLGEVMYELASFAAQQGHRLEYIDVGGGLGVRYEPQGDERHFRHDWQGVNELAIEPKAVADALLASLRQLELPILFEPGRALVANAGLLLTRVLYLKETGGKRFVIVDAGMTELLRPSLYSAYHAIVPLDWRDGQAIQADVVGPICESGDFLARDRRLPPLQRGDLLAVLTAGAYGFSLSSNYNARPRPAEVLVKDDQHRLIRARGRLEALWAG